MTKTLAWPTPIIHKSGYEELASELLMEDLTIDSLAPVGQILYWSQNSKGAWAKLVELIRNTFEEEFSITEYLDIQGSIIKYEINDHQPYHTHSSSLFTGIFYLFTSAGADLILHDPRGYSTKGHNSVWSKPIRIHPESGDLILFPAYVGHEATKHLGPGLRIALPFDVTYNTKPAKTGFRNY